MQTIAGIRYTPLLLLVTYQFQFYEKAFKSTTKATGLGFTNR